MPRPPSDNDAHALLPDILKEWRARHRLTQAEACRILHVSMISTYSRWENGQTGCSLAGLVIECIRLREALESILYTFDHTTMENAQSLLTEYQEE